ncbi:unnamed protein product [Malus baccata var. baccata]
MDVSVMKFSCCAENMKSIPVIVSMVEPVEQLDPISSSHDKQIFTYEGLKPSDDRADLGKFATPHRKTYLSHAWRNNISYVGQEFPGGVKEFRQRLMKYAVEKGFRYVYVRNDNERVIAECFNKDDEGCVWRVHAILNRPSRLLYIKSLNNVYTCKARFRDKKSIKMGSKIVALVLVDKIRTNPIVRPIDVVRDFKKNYGITISYYNAWYGKELAKMKVHGDDTQSYRQLLWYAEAVLATNPGSHVQLDYNDSSCLFERLFISYNGSIEGFKFCRPFLCLDGTFIKNKYKGHLLVAIGKNVGAMASVFAHERKHPKHMGSGYGEVIANLFQKCCYALSQLVFDQEMKTFIKDGATIIQKFLQNTPKENWSNAYFMGKKYGEMCSNIAESFNSWILDERKMPTYQMIDNIRVKLMEMTSDRQREAERWTSPICLTMDDEMMKMVEVGRHWNWQIKGFPCAHALAAILKDGGNPYDYVEDYFTTDFYKSSYSYPIIHVPDIEKDEQSMSQKFVIEPH